MTLTPNTTKTFIQQKHRFLDQAREWTGTRIGTRTGTSCCRYLPCLLAAPSDLSLPAWKKLCKKFRARTVPVPSELGPNRDQLSPDQVVSGGWIRTELQRSTLSDCFFSDFSSFSTLCRCGQVEHRLLLLQVELWVTESTNHQDGAALPWCPKVKPAQSASSFLFFPFVFRLERLE